MPVPEEEVIWCYRLLLGREPESRNAIHHHMSCADRASLVCGGIASHSKRSLLERDRPTTVQERRR